MAKQRLGGDRGNVANAPLRWDIKAAMAEFKLGRRELERRLAAVGELPGEDGCFSTVQLTNAIAGEAESVQTAKLLLEKELLDVKNLTLTGALVERSEVCRALEDIFTAVVATIENGGLPKDQSNALCDQITAAVIERFKSF
jgi:hypothetical protein